MVRKLGIVFMLLAAAGFCACGYSPGSSVGISSTIAPSDGAVDQSLDVQVTVEFGDQVGEPSDWSSCFMLKETEDGDTLCTDVIYVSDGKTATCEHDELDSDTDYIVILTGVVAVNGKQTTFRTGS